MDAAGTITTETMIPLPYGFALVDDLGYPVETTTGPRCGNHHREDRIRHNTAAAVRYCFEIAAEQEAQVTADLAMEAAQLRHLENRGYDDARAQDDYEAAHGVIPFDVAYAQALAAL